MIWLVFWILTPVWMILLMLGYTAPGLVLFIIWCVSLLVGAYKDRNDSSSFGDSEGA